MLSFQTAEVGGASDDLIMTSFRQIHIIRGIPGPNCNDSNSDELKGHLRIWNQVKLVCLIVWNNRDGVFGGLVPKRR